MGKKISSFFILFILCVFLSSCSEVDANAVKQDFIQYSRDDRLVLVFDKNWIYFDDQEIFLPNILEEGIEVKDVLILDNNKKGVIFILAYQVENDYLLYYSKNTIFLYEYDIYKGVLKELANISNYKKMSTCATDDTIYIQYQKKGENEFFLDAYYLSTEKYEGEISKGSQDLLEGIKNNQKSEEDPYTFSTDIEAARIEILNNRTNEKYTVDKEIIQKSGFLALFEKYRFAPKYIVHDSRDQILILFECDHESDFFKTNEGYPWLVLHFDTENEMLLFKGLFFVNDYEAPFKIQVFNGN